MPASREALFTAHGVACQSIGLVERSEGEDQGQQRAIGGARMTKLAAALFGEGIWIDFWDDKGNAFMAAKGAGV